MTYTQTHLVVSTWAETIVVNEPEEMPQAAHAGDRCALADADCDVMFERDEVVFMPTTNDGGSSHADRGLWVCGHHIDWPEATAFERRFLKRRVLK